MSSTILLDADTWDLTLSAGGDIATSDEPYALAQDAASAIRTFSGEVYYDTTQGIPYFADILGHMPPRSLVKHYFNKAALTVPDVAEAKTYLVSFTGRTFTGQVQVTTEDGDTAAVGF